MVSDPHQFLQTLERRTELNAEDKSLLKANADWGKEIAPAMADCFYGYLQKDPEMNAILTETEGRIHRLRETFVQWFHEMFTGMDDWGKSYAERRWRIGLVHVKIGIGPEHVVPAMATVVREVTKLLKSSGKPEDLRESLSKICMIDLAFIEQAYIEVSSAAVLKETGWTAGLFRRLIATGANTMAS
ncbi:protoglobin domain-containing protein [Pseudanabaena sp. PCC 6802]|uniref:protoglobin domain-containing protein n=1 Tax=Pseudanabaena sp. PCC 6802 TaxID=118173 RepID=UPI0003465D3B|nr:protoglobin domain-containing protein [Pseudanabaena sp. PCC 6802]